VGTGDRPLYRAPALWRGQAPGTPPLQAPNVRDCLIISADLVEVPMRRVPIIAIAMAAIICPAHAQEKTYNGNDLIEACRVIASGDAASARDPLQVGICLGEIDALYWYAPGAYDENLRSCPPEEEVSPQLLAKIIVDYLDQNPDRRTEPFEGLALEAFAHKWPCEWGGWFRW
jgi:Ssp1 endopeptidase immunity protein Rap1a